MRTMLEFLRRLIAPVRRSRRDADLEAELRLHVELAAERERRAGHSDAEAARLARVRAGGTAQAMESLRDQRSLPALDAIRADLVFGWRQLRRHRVASVSAVLSLGLAMGATLAAFRLVDAVLLRPLPVADPARLFVVTRTMGVGENAEQRDDYDYATYRKFLAATSGQADLLLMGLATRRQIVIDAGQRETAVQQFVSGNVFTTLGLQPVLGRLIGEVDDVVPDGHPVAVITHDYWRRRFGGDPHVIGRSFRIGARVYDIIGVLGQGFTGTEPGALTEIFVPSMMNPDALKNEGWTWFRIWVRPKPGVDPGHVQTLLQARFHADQAERAKGFAPGTPQWRIDAFLNEPLLLQPAGAGVSGIQQTFRQPLWIVAALAALLLLIASVNVANLLLARAMSRRTEMALRVSIGAARRRLIQLMLIESALLALLACAVGAAFAWAAAPFVVSMLAPPEQPVRLILDLDWRTLGTAVALTLTVTMLFGMAPALRASAVSPLDALQETRGPRGHRRVADVLVAAQMAVCVFLLFGASLFVGTFERLQSRPIGFAPGGLLHLSVESSRTHTPDDWARLAASLWDVPGVESAAVAGWAPLTGNRWRYAVTVAGRAAPEESPYWVSVSPGYFATMRIPLLEGREFRTGDQSPAVDDKQRPIAGVAIVNESFARVYFDGRSPVGQRVFADRLGGAAMEIVGLVADTVYRDLREPIQPGVFVPLEGRYGATVLVRTSADGTAGVGQALRREIPRLRPQMQVRDAMPFSSIVSRQMITERLLAALSAFFAVLALALGVIGLYGVLNYAVTRERRDIGLRMALGARPAHVVTLVTTRLLASVCAGAIAGLVCGVAFGRWAQTLLFQMAPADPSAFSATLLALAVAATLAILPPSLRAVRTDPAQTIRMDA